MPFAVEFITCKHLTEEDLVEQTLDVKVFDGLGVDDIKCTTCSDTKENWICLKCGVIGCSRYVNQDANQHYEDNPSHSLAASFSDHSVWCYECQAYVIHHTLTPVYHSLGRLKSLLNDKVTDPKDKEKSEEKVDSIKISENKEDEKENETRNDINNTTTTTTSSTTTSSNHSPVKIDRHDINQDLDLGDSSSESEDESLKAEKGGLLKAMMDMFIGKDKSTTGIQTLSELNLKGIANYIKQGKAKNIIVCTGAGISVAAGIPDFRSPKTGLYQNLAKYNLPYKTAIFDMEYFLENPKPFFVLAKELYPGSFNPTHVHYFIKLLEEKGLLLRNYTQNIDTLERVAKINTELLVEAHGTFATAKCIKCKEEHSCEFVKERVFGDKIPICKICGGVVKPDIVFFGESLPSRFSELVREDFPKCDMLIVLGTSLMVQPFASLVSMAPPNIPRLLINLEEVGSDSFGGFKFTDPSNKRDVKWIGDCQQGVIELVDLLGWKDELSNLVNK